MQEKLLNPRPPPTSRHAPAYDQLRYSWPQRLLLLRPLPRRLQKNKAESPKSTTAVSVVEFRNNQFAATPAEKARPLGALPGPQLGPSLRPRDEFQPAVARWTYP